ncbi:MAG: guanylate cyclase, partial [Leptospiraceae bacterium]|nr:guanylate cyclase [Leptospiraceae bacterium]
FFVCGVNDALYNNELIHTGNLYPFGLFIFIFSQSFILSLLFAKSFLSVEHLSEELKLTNKAYTRFVPKEFLNFLSRKSIIDIKLGDQVQKEMTVLFSDIRAFTTLSEQMTPEENFNFINSYLKRMNPIIEYHNGFIDKYIGDAIMALFARSPEDAIRSAIQMQKAILAYNQDRIEKNYEIIKIGVGLHTGVLMLGVIGGEERMESTVISDAVNLASRLEGLTKVYGALILTSEATFLKANGPEKFKYRRLGKAKVKGKQEPVVIIDILDGQSDFWLDVYLETKSDFEKALTHYEAKEFTEAAILFESILDINLSDVAARFYLQKSLYYQTHGLPEDWDGSESV